MTQKEYMQRLIELENKINCGELDNVLEEIQGLEKYKPVRLQLDYLKVKYKLANPEKWNSLIGDVFNKFFLGYNYPYLDETLEAICKAYTYRKSELHRRKTQYIRDSLSGKQEHYGVLLKYCENYLMNKTDVAERYFYLEMYAAAEFLGVMIHYLSNEIVQGGKSKLPFLEQAFKGNNLDYFKEQIREKDAFPFVFFQEEHNELLTEILTDELCAMGKKVFCIGKALEYSDDVVKVKDTIAVSVQYCVERNGVMHFTPVELTRSDGKRESNVMYLLEYITQKYADGKCLNILASGFLIDELSQIAIKGTFFSRLTDYKYEILEHTMAYAIYGNYLSYISNIYCKDCEKLLKKKTTVRFSIVIPARNSAEVLRYTLKTCLEQRFQGSYEIIISDNSTGGNTEVYDLCQKLKNDKVVYIKTPRDLRLARSFEFACLHARGEYILSLGSDDGLLPWALEILDAVTQTYPSEEIIQWERGFYAWPGFNGGQENQFIIPDKYEKGKIHLHYRKKEDYLKALMEDAGHMYSLPMLYINSCFNRRYLQNVLCETGRLWDGICQDIYMGVITAVTHEKILNMRYPLSIAGMSQGSVGANANKSQVTNEQYWKMINNMKKDNEVGGYCRSVSERLLPTTGTDISSLYTSLLRAVDIGVIETTALDNFFEWKKMFLHLWSEMNVQDVAYDMKIHNMRYTAAKHGEEFLEWFDMTIYNKSLEPKLLKGPKIRIFEKFKEEELANGGVILDASKHDVFDIYGATKLFEKMTEL